jgi:hypothetical protein
MSDAFFGLAEIGCGRRRKTETSLKGKAMQCNAPPESAAGL